MTFGSSKLPVYGFLNKPEKNNEGAKFIDLFSKNESQQQPNENLKVQKINLFNAIHLIKMNNKILFCHQMKTEINYYSLSMEKISSVRVTNYINI